MSAKKARRSHHLHLVDTNEVVSDPKLEEHSRIENPPSSDILPQDGSFYLSIPASAGHLHQFHIPYHSGLLYLDLPLISGPVMPQISITIMMTVKIVAYIYPVLTKNQ